MGLTEWLTIGVVGIILRSAMKKTAEEQACEATILKEFKEKQKVSEIELDRQKSVEQERKKTPCYFNDGLSFEDFSKIAHSARKHIKRVKSISISGAIVCGVVESQTGITDWSFEVDFNNWGHITGRYWKQSENNDSLIPKHFCDLMSSSIQRFLKEKDLLFYDFSKAVDQNSELGTKTGLSFNNRRMVKKLFSKTKRISLNYPLSHLLGEHVYPIISLLKSNGFLKIKCLPLKDITDKSANFIYEVERISIDGNTNFKHSQMFDQDAEVIIFYHDKKEIIFPFSENDYKGKNYMEVCTRLQELGFSEICEKPIRDLLTGWFVKDGTVEQILLDEKGNKRIKKKTSYSYDSKFVITYHTFKKK